MYIKDINFAEHKTVTVPCLEYKPDGNTPTVKNHRLYMIDELFEDAELKGFALLVPSDIHKDFVILYYKAGGGKNYLKNSVINNYTEVEKLIYSLKNSTELLTLEGYKKKIVSEIECEIWIRKTELVPLVEFGEKDLLLKCMAVRKHIQKRREEEKRKLEEELAERERREEEQRNKEIEEAKMNMIKKIKEGGNVVNVEVHGKNIIQLLCEDAGINVPLRTKGWMMDTYKFVSFDNTLGVKYRGKKCSQKVFDIIGQLVNIYKYYATIKEEK